MPRRPPVPGPPVRRQGYPLFHFEQAFLVTDMWACFALRGALGYGLNAARLVLERRLPAWHRAAHDDLG